MMTIITLLVFGILLLLLEIVIPGGVVGIIGILCITIGVILGFLQSALIGLCLFIGVIILGTIAFSFWVKYFPKSRIGKQIFLNKDAKDWQGYDPEFTKILGKTGITHTELRPSGTVFIENKRFDVVTEGELITKGATIEVIKVEGNRIVVRPLQESS